MPVAGDPSYRELEAEVPVTDIKSELRLHLERSLLAILLAAK